MDKLRKDSLEFTLVSGNPKHQKDILREISLMPIKTVISHFDTCEELLKHLGEDHNASYRIIVLDMDDPENVGMECLKAVRQKSEYTPIVIICYSRQEVKEAVDQIFVEGGNIFFEYPKSKEKFNSVLQELVKLNWRLYITGGSRKNLFIKL